MPTAQALFQRFCKISNRRKFDFINICLGHWYRMIIPRTKLEECPVRIRDLINVYDLLLLRARHTSATSSVAAGASSSSTPFYYEPMPYFFPTVLRPQGCAALVVAKMQILKRLGFNAQVQLPYSTMINYIRVLGLADVGGVTQKAWGYLKF
ncbi:hypothetical protein FS837_009721 [Tulasnella sp. UAMH 9824]|nr:hypothetical protein FS837_009721 [Tulasnella sp. UAMH 9824]